ncbi:MAG: hypothetical protein II369_06180 [Clostridia bacterium]|nr:hypothetical protein [Clostridia bacterium]MBQ1963689.1 hypothetical protein [Clostridia bacterium]
MKKKCVSLLRLSSLLLSLLLLLCACADVPKMKVEEERYYNSQSGIAYLEAPLCYKASSYLKSGAVAKISEKKMDDVILYQISEGVPSEMMLSTENFDLFYAEGVTLPTLSQMKPHRVHLGQSDAVTVTFSLITDEKDIAALLAAYQGPISFSESEVYWVLMDYEKHELRFESEQYPGIYYYLDYYHCSEEIVVEDLIKDPTNFERRFQGVEVTVSEYKGAYYAAYHFGYGVLRDPETGICYPAADIVGPYLNESAE